MCFPWFTRNFRRTSATDGHLVRDDCGASPRPNPRSRQSSRFEFHFRAGNADDCESGIRSPETKCRYGCLPPGRAGPPPISASNRGDRRTIASVGPKCLFGPGWRTRDAEHISSVQTLDASMSGLLSLSVVPRTSSRNHACCDAEPALYRS